MLSATFTKVRELRPSLRALIALFLIYNFTGSMVGIFLQIFLYSKFTNIELNALATLTQYGGIMLGFCATGYLASRLRFNIKRCFVMSFVVLAGAIFYLLFIETPTQALLAMFIYGIGNGLFWLPVNTFELTETQDHERDFYSSVLNAATRISGLLGPAFATVLILVSHALHWGEFTLLFIVAPAIYLLGFLCFSRIRDYYPSRVVWADIWHFFTDRRNRLSQLYLMGDGFQQFLGVTIPPLAIFFILGTVLKVGIYNTIFAVLSAACILIIARYRTPNNRLRMFALTTVGLVAITAWFGYTLTFAALIIFTILEALLTPINNVSRHVISLSSMEIGRTGSDFYATMLLRDFFLWIWRSVGGLVFLIALQFFTSEREFFSVGLYLLAGAILLTYLGAVFLVRAIRSPA